MPIYTNTSAGPLPFPGVMGGLVPAGVAVTLPRYVWPIPDGFELTSESGNDTPCATLFNGSISATPITGLAAYRQITVTNGTNAALNVHVNGDTTNTGGANLIVLAAGATRILPNDKAADGLCEYGSLSLSGAGTGSVVIVGFANYARGTVR